MAVVTICSDFGAQENKVSHCFHVSGHEFEQTLGDGEPGVSRVEWGGSDRE